MGDIDTSGIQQKIQRFQQKLQQAQQAGAGGSSSGQGGTTGQQGQQGGMGLSGGGQQKPERVKTAQQIEAAEKSLTQTVERATSERQVALDEETVAAVKASERKRKAKEAERKATEKALERQIASSQRGAKNAKDAAGAMVAQIRKIIQAKIAQTIASAIAPLGPMAPILGAGIAAAVNALFNSVLPSFRTGGEIRGPGGPRDDQVPVMASDKEYIVNARSAQAAPNTIRRINESPAEARRIEEQEQGGASVQAPRSARRPTGRRSGGVGPAPAEEALVGVEQAVREQTEAIEDMDVGVRDLDEKLTRFRSQKSDKGV